MVHSFSKIKVFLMMIFCGLISCNSFHSAFASQRPGHHLQTPAQDPAPIQDILSEKSLESATFPNSSIVEQTFEPVGQTVHKAKTQTDLQLQSGVVTSQKRSRTGIFKRFIFKPIIKHTSRTRLRKSKREKDGRVWEILGNILVGLMIAGLVVFLVWNAEWEILVGVGVGLLIVIGGLVALTMLIVGMVTDIFDACF